MSNDSKVVSNNPQVVSHNPKVMSNGSKRVSAGHRFLRNPVHRSAAEMCRGDDLLIEHGVRRTPIYRSEKIRSVNRCPPDINTLDLFYARHIFAALRCTGLRKNRCPADTRYPIHLPTLHHPTTHSPSYPHYSSHSHIHHTLHHPTPTPHPILTPTSYPPLLISPTYPSRTPHPTYIPYLPLYIYHSISPHRKKSQGSMNLKSIFPWPKVFSSGFIQSLTIIPVIRSCLRDQYRA